MRFWLTLAVAVAGVSLSGVAEQASPPANGKPSSEFKVKDQSNQSGPRSSAPALKAKGGTASSAKNLQAIERETPKGNAHATQKKVPATLLQSRGNKPNPKISVKGSNGAKNTGLVHQGKNPLEGRLRQKGGH